MNGIQLIESIEPIEDAPIITRLLNAGVDIIGKILCEGLCFSRASFICTRDLVYYSFLEGYNSGGSSSGSADEVAKGIVT